MSAMTTNTCSTDGAEQIEEELKVSREVLRLHEDLLKTYDEAITDNAWYAVGSYVGAGAMLVKGAADAVMFGLEAWLTRGKSVASAGTKARAGVIGIAYGAA